MTDWSPVEKLLTEAVGGKATPGISVGCWFQGRLLRTFCAGRFTFDDGEPPVTVETVYDLASITKAFCTAPLVWLRIQSGEWSPEMSLDRFYSDLKDEPQGRVNLGQLLRHVSGYPALAHLEQMGANAAEGAYHLLKFTQLESPPGANVRYSDVGYLLLGDILQRTSGRTLDDLFRAEILAPLKLKGPVFRPNGVGPILGDGIAPTSIPEGYLRTLQGVVEDENTRFLGGISGASGLFGNLLHAGQYVCALRECSYQTNGLFSRDILDRMWTVPLEPSANTWTFGWDTPSDDNSTAGRYLSAGSVGHLGYTGTSVWYDRSRDLIIVTLANRVCPTRANAAFNPYRAKIHDAIMESLGFDFPRARRFG